jgi:hypothetical protein
MELCTFRSLLTEVKAATNHRYGSSDSYDERQFRRGELLQAGGRPSPAVITKLSLLDSPHRTCAADANSRRLLLDDAISRGFAAGSFSKGG